MLQGNQKSVNNYLIKQLPKATVFVNDRKTIVYASDLWLNEFQLENSSITGENIYDLFKNSNPEWKIALSESLKGTPNLALTERYFTCSTNKKWFEIKSTPWYGENENVIGTILQTADVTERVLSEMKLEMWNVITKDLSDIGNIGFWDYNLVDDCMFWDNQTKSIHQLPEDYTPTFIDIIDFYKLGNSRNTISMLVNKAITLETSFSEKLQLVTAKGNEIWVITSGKPIYKNGEFIGIVGTIQDINEHQIHLEKTNENQRLLRTLIDNIPLNISIKDLESRKILVNKSEMEFYNVKSEEEIIGKDNFDFFPKEIAEESKKEDLSVMRDLKPILGKECDYKSPSGTNGTALISKIPLIDVDGHAYGLACIRMDISDLKKKELELLKLINVTSVQNEKLINFAHIVSHNLRSHSANFSMLLDFLVIEKSKEERTRIVTMLQDSSDNLLETLDDLNEVVNITRNTKLIKKRISINKKILHIQQNLSAEIKQHKILIINTIKESVKINVAPIYIESILMNIITNAIKYRSPHRNSEIKFEAETEGNYTVISITDNGIGIDLNKYGDKIFGMYKTFHNNKNAKGIGLYITKNQIEAMNGKLKVQSKIGQGSTFKIYFNDKN